MSFLKIFNTERRSIDSNLTDEGTSAVSCLLGAGWQADSPSTSLSAYFAARNLISSSIAQLPILTKVNKDVVERHKLTLLFDTALMNKFNLIKRCVEDMIDFGSALVYIRRAQDGTPVELVYCEHGSYSVDYRQNKQRLFFRIPWLTKSIVEPCDVLYLYNNSNNGVEGRALTTYANKVLALAKATDKTAKNYFTSGCAISGALTIKGARRNAKEQARQAFADVHNGTTAAGLVILDDDCSYQALGSNSSDAQMLETRQYNVAEIARYFNMSPVLLGDLSNSSYNTIEAVQLDFLTHTLLPYISVFECEFNRKLVKPSQTNVVIDLDESYLLRTDKTSMSTYLNTLVSGGIMTVNEARLKLGLEPMDGGDKLIVAYTDIQQNTINDTETEDEEGSEKD